MEEARREAEGSAVWLRPHVDDVPGGLSHRLGGRGEKGWALVGQDGGLKAFSFAILPHAVSSKPRYLSMKCPEGGGRQEFYTS